MDASVVATFTVVVSSSVVGDDVVRVGEVVASAELVSVVTSVVPRLMSNGFNKMTCYLCQTVKRFILQLVTCRLASKCHTKLSLDYKIPHTFCSCFSCCENRACCLVGCCFQRCTCIR